MVVRQDLSGTWVLEKTEGAEEFLSDAGLSALLWIPRPNAAALLLLSQRSSLVVS